MSTRSDPREPAGRSAVERREPLHALADDIGAILWEAELPSWRCTFVSDQAEGILGHPVERWLEAPGFWAEVIHPEDRDRAVAYSRECVEKNEDHQLEYRALAADGSVVWIRDIVRILREGGRPSGMRGMMLDITETKRFEAELRTRTTQLAAVSDAMTSFLETGDWRQASAGLLLVALEETGSEYGFVGVATKDTLRILAHQGIQWDETIGRELYESALRLYEERGYLEFTSFDNLFGRVITGGLPVISNEPARDDRSGGLPPGHPPLESFLGVPIIKGDQVVGMVGIANRRGGYTGEEQDKLEILCRAVGVLYESYLRGLREAELEAQLSQAQKMDALGQLAGGIAHDFNNLLTAIIGNAELARLSLGPDGPAPSDASLQEALEEIQRCGERAGELTSQLLVFGRKETAKLEPLRLDRAVNDALRILDRTIGEHIGIRIDLAPGLPKVVADRAQLEQVVLNLALNARDAMPEGGMLSVRAYATGPSRDGDCDASGHASEEWVVVEVTDTGHGMEPQILRQVFEPFFTTKPMGRGTGLGLATTYGAVTQFGGRIEVDSEPGKGSCFRVFLPSARGSRGSSSPAGALASIADAAGATPPAASEDDGRLVLICEDESSVRRLICAAVRRAGHRVLEAAGPGEALRLASEHPEPVDLLLTDVVMPEFNGKILADRMLEQNPDLKVLFVSGHTADHLSAHLVTGELPALLRKPFSPERLIEHLQDLLA